MLWCSEINVQHRIMSKFSKVTELFKGLNNLQATEFGRLDCMQKPTAFLKIILFNYSS